MKNEKCQQIRNRLDAAPEEDSPVRNRSNFFSFVALVFLGLDWTLTGFCGWACCWVWAGLQRKGWLLEWGRLLGWGRLLRWGCLTKPDHSLDRSPLEGQPALVKAEVSLLSHLIPVLGTLGERTTQEKYSFRMN
jgi:hypothetical protein